MPPLSDTPKPATSTISAPAATEAIANADAHLSNSGLPTYSELLKQAQATTQRIRGMVGIHPSHTDELAETLQAAGAEMPTPAELQARWSADTRAADEAQTARELEAWARQREQGRGG